MVCVATTRYKAPLQTGSPPPPPSRLPRLISDPAGVAVEAARASDIAAPNSSVVEDDPSEMLTRETAADAAAMVAFL